VIETAEAELKPLGKDGISFRNGFAPGQIEEGEVSGKQTWKLTAGLAAEAAKALRTTSSISAAARAIGVAPSTLSRAIKEGRLQVAPRPTRAEAAAEPCGSFLAWVTTTYELSRHEWELAQLAQQALELARHPDSSPNVRLQAMSQYRAAIKDLRLPVEGVGYGDTEGYPRRVG